MKKRPAGDKLPPQSSRVAKEAQPSRIPERARRPFLSYTCFEINNFRCFECFELRPLSLVNLITGANGVGKTAILEAFLVHLGAVNPALALRVNLWRGLGVSGEWSSMLWRTLFWQLREAEPICLLGTDSRRKKRKLTITMLPTTAAIAQDGTVGMGLEFAKNLSRDLALEYQDESGQVSTVKVVPEIVKLGNVVQIQLKADPPEGKAPLRGIMLNSWRQGSSEEDVRRFSDLRIRNQDHVILDVLKYMEPRLENLEILSPHGASMIHGHLKGYDEPILLSLLGDGVRRVASLVLAIGSARGGVLLVDEIENGIHHSVMTPLWEGIGQAADLFNTQVIATTHSLECVSAAYEAFRTRKSFDLTLHHLDRTDGAIRAIAYDQESLEGALSIPMEVRG